MTDRFLGNEHHIQTIEKRVLGLLEGYRQNIAIVGDELVGKTTLVTTFLERFSDNRLVMVYLESRPEPIASFARRFIGVLLYNFLSNSAQPLKEDLEFLVSKSEKYIPRTVAEIRSILAALEKRKKTNIFTDLLTLCDTLHQETQKSCVVIFDEFLNLEKMGVGTIYRDWSKVLISQKNTMYIIISSQKFKTKTILSKDLSLLFGNFEIIGVEPFNIKTAESYLDQRLGQTSTTPQVKDFLVHFTGGLPFYLELITEELVKSAPAGLTDILVNLLYDSSGALNQRFSVYVKRYADLAASKEYLDILHHLACGHNKIKDLAHLIKKPVKELNKRVSLLLETDVVSRNADFLKINDRVFGFWLRFVYQEKNRSLTFDPRNQKARLEEKIGAMVQEFLAQAKKPVLERVEELLRHFEDETIQIEKKKIKLTRFREIKPLELETPNIRDGLLGRSNEGTWIIAFKNDSLTENDITEFSRECRKYRNRLEKKIIVTFRDIDANTRLRALDEKIWAMDMNSLNQIFDLFFMPRVIA